MTPVYSLEWRQAFRRVHKYPLRWLYAGIVLIEMQWLTVVAIQTYFTGDTDRAVFVAETLLSLILLQQTLAILLATPAFACGSISDERRRGTLDFMLMSPLSSAEIVLGKWLGQTLQVLHLLSPAYYAAAILVALIGQPASLLWGFVGQAMLTTAIAAFSLLASMWNQSTTRAIVSVYLGFAFWLCLEGAWHSGAIESLFLPTSMLEGNEALFLGLCGRMLLVTVAAVVGASVLLRPGHARQHQARLRVLGRWWDRPPIGDAPMRWKERFTGEGWSIPLWRRLPRWQRCLLLATLILAIGLALPHPETFLVLGLAQAILSGWITAVRCAGSITGEREKQTWDALAVTPMDAYQMVRGKLWGQIDAMYPYLMSYLVPALLGAALTDWCSVLWIGYTWLGGWVYMYYLGAFGVLTSATAVSTWRSIFITMSLGNYRMLYLGGLFALIGTAFGFCMLACVVPAWLPESLLLAFGTMPGLVWLFGQTEELLLDAQRELSRQWVVYYPPMFPHFRSTDD